VEDGMTNAIMKEILPGKDDLQPNQAVAKILREYADFELCRDYDKFVFSTLLMGVLRRKE